MENLKGSMTALITPFKNGKLDTKSYEYLIKRQIEQGIDVVIPVGTTGESATLTHREHEECIEIAIQTCKNSHTKVIAGAGSNATQEAISLAQFAQKAGADGILTVTPYYNKPTQNGLYEHYKTIATSVEIPVMLYNVPSRTGVNLEVDTVIKLFDDFENIFAIKEATGDLARATQMISQREKFGVLSGDDLIDYPMLASGCSGIISVTANLLPNMKSELVNKINENNFAEALAIHNKLEKLNRSLFSESNPIPIKAAMYLAGLLDTLEYRLPLTQPSSDTLKLLESILIDYKVIK